MSFWPPFDFPGLPGHGGERERAASSYLAGLWPLLVQIDQVILAGLWLRLYLAGLWLRLLRYRLAGQLLRLLRRSDLSDLLGLPFEVRHIQTLSNPLLLSPIVPDGLVTREAMRLNAWEQSPRLEVVVVGYENFNSPNKSTCVPSGEYQYNSSTELLPELSAGLLPFGPR